MSFINESVRPQLHPEVTWELTNDGKLQLRMPGDNVTTFVQQGESIAEVLAYFRGDDVSVDTLDTRIYRAVNAMLLEKGGLVNFEKSENQLVSLMQEHAVRNGDVGGLKKGPTSVKIIGEGKLASLAREVVASSDTFTVSEGTSEDTLAVVLADVDDIPYFQSVNQELIDNKQPALFICWTPREFKSFFMVPGETPCFACLFQREMASSQFPEELHAYSKLSPEQRPGFEGGVGMEQMAVAIITRMMMSVLSGNFDAARPGTQTMIDPVVMLIDHAPIMQLPRCKVCGPVTKSVVPSIHDMIEAI